MSTGKGNGSTVVRRQLGRKLRRFREEAGKSHADVEAAQIASATKMWRIESGRSAVKPGDIWALARLYDVSNQMTDALVNLAAGTRDEGWWEEFVTAPDDDFGLYTGLEATASLIQSYHPELVHALLQTPDYAREVILADQRPGEDTLSQRLAVRSRRQALGPMGPVGRNGRRMQAIIGAGALSLVVGSPELMAAQISHLQTFSANAGIEVRILPWTAGAHPSMEGAFTILGFDDPDDPALVHVETHLGARYLEQVAQVTEYRRIFGALQSKSVSLEEYMS
jgi:transcriptional regulator with XRE-family HTH domain